MLNIALSVPLLPRFNRKGVPGLWFFVLFRVLLLFFSPSFFTSIFNGFVIDFGRVWRVFWEVILATCSKTTTLSNSAFRLDGSYIFHVPSVPGGDKNISENIVFFRLRFLLYVGVVSNEFWDGFGQGLGLS